MADINEILGRQINSVRELKSAISDLQNSLIGLDTESEEFKTTSQQLAAAQEELTKVTRAGKEENVAATDSLVGMQREYKELYNTYKMLSDEQRNSDFGKQMAASLDELSTKINETKQGVGNFTSNIGNYTNSAISAFKQMGQAVQGLNSPLKLAGGGAKALGQSLKALIANPVGAVIMAIVIALKGMQEALKRSEEAQRKFNQALEAFKPVADFVLQIFEALVEVISDVIKWVGDFTTNLLGLENNAKNAASAVDTLAVANAKLAAGYAEMDLYDQNRKQTIQDLREQLEATKDLAKKQEILNQIKQLQATIDENAQIKAHNAVSQALTDLKFYQEELERAIQLEAEGKITAEELADAKIKLANAQEAYNKALKDESAAQYTARKNTEKLDKEIKNLGKSTKSTAKATENLAEKAKNLYENIVENSKTEIQKVTDKYEKEKKLLEKYHYDTTLLTKKYNEDISKIIKKEEDKRRSAYLNGLKQAGADYKAELDLILKRDGEFIATVEQQDLLQYKIIPAVREVRKEIDDLIFSIADGDTLKEIVNLLNTEGFAGLGEDYADIKNKIEEINAEYGLSITTLKNLDLTIENLNDRNKELTNNLFSATFAEVTAERLVDAYEWAFEEIKELGIEKETRNLFIPGDWNFDFIKEVMLEKEYELLEQQKYLYENQLQDFQGTQEQKLEILQNYYAVVEEMEARHQALSEMNQQRTQEMVDNLAASMDNLGGALSTIKGSYDSLIDSELKAGKIDEKEAEKKKRRLSKLEIAQQAFSIATIAADAASGIFSIWKGYATETGVVNPQTAAATGPAAAATLAVLNTKSLISAIAKTTSLAATATAQIMAARNGIITASNNMSDTSGGASVAATPYLIDSTPVSYTRTVQTEEDEDYLNQRPIWVSVEDISSALGHQAVVKDESSF